MNNRPQALAAIADQTFDVWVIGGGATGSGCALDARRRGLRTVLLEASDFAGATSSTSTKIVHGGVRYLEAALKRLDPAQYRVVKRALQERVRMLRNAPHVTRAMEFLLPCYSWFGAAYYDIGLKMYDWVSGGASIFPNHFLSRKQTSRRNPAIRNRAANLISEIIATLVLVFVVAAIVSKGVATAGGLPPGFGAYVVACLVWGIGLSPGGTTGYAINPARDLGPRIAHAVLPIAGKGASDWSYAAIPVIGPLIGGGIAGLLIRLMTI
jgi:FAD dependent oxidoreductase/major intrinsic protein